jgi:hypothetical protein
VPEVHPEDLPSDPVLFSLDNYELIREPTVLCPNERIIIVNGVRYLVKVVPGVVHQHFEI